MNDRPTPIDPGPDPIHTLRPDWKQIVMVCKDCEKRSKAPKKFGARQVAKALSSALRQARQPKTRIVQTTCMGLCPKKALAVAAPAADGQVRVIAWRKPDRGADALQALLGAAADRSHITSTLTLSSPNPSEQT